MPSNDPTKMAFSYTPTVDENEMLFLIEIILQRDFSRYVWLRSDKFFDHLEELFTVHLPATAEWS